MSESINTEKHSNDTERSDIQNDGSEQAEDDEDGGGARIAPIEKGMETLELGGEVAEDGLDSASECTKAVVAMTDNIVGLRAGNGVEFFIEFFGGGGISERELDIHVGRVAGAKAILPSTDEEHVEEEGGQYELRIPDEDEVEDMDEDGGDRILPVTDFLEPASDARESGEDHAHAVPIGLTSSDTPPGSVDVEHITNDFKSDGRFRSSEMQGDDFNSGFTERIDMPDVKRFRVMKLR